MSYELDRKALVKAAKELNTLLGLKPLISLKAPVKELTEELIAATELLEPQDIVSSETKKVIDALQKGQKGNETEGESQKLTGTEKKKTTPVQSKQETKKEGKVPTEKKEEKAAPVKKEGKVPTEKKEKNPGKAIPGHQGSITQVMDSLIIAGGTWASILEATQAEAEKRGKDSKKYSIGTLRQHVRFRIKNGFPTKGQLDVTVSDTEVHVGE